HQNAELVCRRVRIAAVRTTTCASHGVIALGDVVENAGVGKSCRSRTAHIGCGTRQRVQDIVRDALALPSLLIDQRHNRGEGWRCRGSPTYGLKIVIRVTGGGREIATAAAGGILVRLTDDVKALSSSGYCPVVA